MTDVASRRFFTNTLSCVSVRFSPLLVCLISTFLVSFLCPTAPPAFLRLPPVLLWVHPSHLQVPLVLQKEEREVRLREGCLLSSTSASVVFRQLLEFFLLTSRARRVVARFARVQLFRQF